MPTECWRDERAAIVAEGDALTRRPGNPSHQRRNMRGGSRRRPGFTLLELMIVLAIAAALMAVAWPSLRQPMAKSRGRQAAQDLIRALVRARFDAIRQGRMSVVRFLPGTRNYRVESSFHSTTQPAISGRPTARSGYANTAANTTRALVEPPWEELPPGVRFWTPELRASNAPSGAFTNRAGPVDAVPAMVRPPSTSSEANATVVSQNFAPALPAIRFFPSGRSDSAAVRLLTAEGRVVVVRIRGLTGQYGIETEPRPNSAAPAADPLAPSSEASRS